MLQALFQKYAPYLEATAPQSIDKFLFEGFRQRHETFAAFIAAKTLSLQEMQQQLGERVCPRLCGRILMKHANLNELQRELLMLRGPLLRTFDEVAEMLRPLDRPEMLAAAKSNDGEHTKQSLGSTRNFISSMQQYGDDYDDEGNQPPIDDGNDDPEDFEGYGSTTSTEDQEGHEYLFFEDREYEEHEAIELMAYHTAYRDVRRELQKRKNERGFCEKRQVLECEKTTQGKRKVSSTWQGKELFENKVSIQFKIQQTDERVRRRLGRKITMLELWGVGPFLQELPDFCR